MPRPPYRPVRRVLAASRRAASSSSGTSSRPSRLAARLPYRVQVHCTRSVWLPGFCAVFINMALLASCQPLPRLIQRHRARPVSPRGFRAIVNVIALFASRCPAFSPCPTSWHFSHLAARLRRRVQTFALFASLHAAFAPCPTPSRLVCHALRLSCREKRHCALRVSLQVFFTLYNYIPPVTSLRAASATCPTSLRSLHLAVRLPRRVQNVALFASRRADFAPCETPSRSTCLVLQLLCREKRHRARPVYLIGLLSVSNVIKLVLSCRAVSLEFSTSSLSSRRATRLPRRFQRHCARVAYVYGLAPP